MYIAGAVCNLKRTMCNNCASRPEGVVSAKYIGFSGEKRCFRDDALIPVRTRCKYSIRSGKIFTRTMGQRALDKRNLSEGAGTGNLVLAEGAPPDCICYAAVDYIDCTVTIQVAVP